MRLSRSANPALNKSTFAFASFDRAEGEVMTINGTVYKTFIMLVLVVAGAFYTWNMFFKALPENAISAVSTWLLVGGIGGFILALVTVFKKTWAYITAPLYAFLEGLFLGGISAIFEAQFAGEGIVLRAVLLTFGTLFALLAAYRSGLIKVTRNFKLGVVAATGGIALVYFISFIASMFGANISFLHGNSILSIIISLVVVVVAALNLVLDFDFIEEGAKAGAPKYMEWYAAFGLMITLVWLYLEILRLLAKLSSRD